MMDFVALQHLAVKWLLEKPKSREDSGKII